MGDKDYAADNNAYRSVLLLREAIAAAHITAEVDIVKHPSHRRAIKVTLDLNNADHLAHILDATDAH